MNTKSTNKQQADNIINRQLEHSQFKESSFALAKHTALSQQSTSLIRNFRFRSKAWSVTGFTPNI